MRGRKVFATFLAVALAFSFMAKMPDTQAASKRIEKGPDDIVVIPDKYNTGATGTLTMFENLNDEQKLVAMDGLKVAGGNPDTGGFRINLKSVNAKTTGFVINNVDFSSVAGDNYRFYFTNPTDKIINITFNNCKFESFSGGAGVKCTLNNCTFQSFSGTNTVCNKCQFGHSYNDAIRAFNDAYFNNCYIADFQYPFYSENEKASQHIDGVQIFGNTYGSGETKGKDAGNIHFYNCRFEIPAYYIPPKTMPNGTVSPNRASMNDCIMVQNEYSDASNITFENIITNGANYQFSAHRGTDHKTKETRNLKEVSLTNCRMGEGSILGTMTSVEDFVKLTNVGINNSLYIASSWKDSEGYTHFSVTNDCIREKKLTIVTDKGVEAFTIPAYTPASVSLKEGSNITFDDYPIDMDIKVKADKYAVCYDTTFACKQIRFVNYTNNPVTIDESILDAYVTPIVVVDKGKCGKNLTFSLTNDGVLTIEGTGEMNNYHSKCVPEWDRANIDVKEIAQEPKPYIRKVVVKEGVTSIGAQAFSKNGNLQEVVLPNTLETIGSRAFAGCNSLFSINIPDSLKSIGKDAFVNVFTVKIDEHLKTHTVEKKVTPATDKTDGKVEEICEQCQKVIKTTAISKIGSAKISTATYTYSGKAKQPAVSVVDSKGNAISSEFYTVSYTNNKNVGLANVRIVYKGNYSGETNLSFKILPKKTKITKATVKNGKLTLRFKKVKSQITGYEIRLATNKKFTKNVKKITIRNKKATKKILKKLKPKKYYIKIRTYKIANKVKYYSAWTKYSKRVKINRIKR